MCGIVGYIGDKKAAPLLFEGLKKLEYRGYDSAGIATLHDGRIITEKDIGKLDEIGKKTDFARIDGNIGISHCRWATHGKVSRENAHPHCNYGEDISIVHNGIIENHDELKKKLVAKGYKFCSETDTEVIVHLIEDNYKGDLKDAVINALKHVDGSYALGVISSKEPDKIIAARNESPLIIGVGSGENFIASDVPAILKHTKKVIYLGNKEIAVLTKGNVDVLGLDGKAVKKDIEEIKWSAEQAEKSGYKHFMLK